MSELEPIQITMADGSIKVYKLKTLSNFINATVDTADNIDYIEGFNIPILKVKGLAYKNNVRYVSMRDVYKSLNKKADMFTYPLKKIELIYDLETITKQEYKRQVISRTQFYKSVGRPTLTLISLEDVIQVLNFMQSRKETDTLVRNLLLKIIELKKKLKEERTERQNLLTEMLFKLDKIAFEFICTYENRWRGYQALWDTQIWEFIIFTIREKRKLLGLEIPLKKNTGLHHLERDKPYRLIYPHVATKGHLIDKRFDHDDPRNRRYL